MTHWTEQQLIESLYGLREADEHFQTCPACRTKAEAMQAVRHQTSSVPEVSPEFLAAQRRAIYQRLGEPQHKWASLRWALPILATLLVVFGVSFEHFRSTPAPAPIYTKADQQLFSELASMDQDVEPRAAQPIHNLFED